ncbi:hypothetical protein [Streptomyces sp. NPDC056190]|uniref:hypothetical protein n=1 Tax=Streptomyces sp. NPDC056190 TaxID=3345741 RepID=UPI0035E39B80
MVALVRTRRSWRAAARAGTTPALRASWLWWLGLIVCVALLYLGLEQRARALAVVLDSVATQLIESPTMAAVTRA